MRRRLGRQEFRTLGRALRFLRRYRRTVFLVYAALFISTAAQLIVPWLVRIIIDRVTEGNTTGTDTVIIAAGIAIIVFALSRGVFSFVQGYMAERLSQNAAFDLRNDLFAKIQRLSFSYHDRSQTGQLMVRATDDVEKVRQFVGQGLLLTVQAVLLLVGTFTILILTNLRLTLLALTILPLALIIFVFFGLASQSLYVALQNRLSELNTKLQENLAGIRVVKAFVQEQREQQRLTASANEVMAANLKISGFFAFIYPATFLVVSLGQAVIFYAGSFQILDGTLTLGEWQQFSLYLIYLFFPLGQIGFILSLMGQAAASAARIFEILDTENDVEDKPGAVTLGPISGHVQFKDVSFRYFKSGEYVLRDVSFEAQPGQTVALLGATGSGKTTIINLLPRFYEVTEGQVLIDGLDVRDVTLNSLRSTIGIVLQETTLFAGTIRDNIAFGRPDAGLDEVIAAAQAAAAHDFITSFPQGYDTPVGERGATLSGGQKQRIAIARALLLNPRILILDNSTSSVDVTTETQIQRALDRLMEGRTSFVIAQRISTVLHADLILVLDKGMIAAQGRHEELMETSPVYVEIYQSQLAIPRGG